MESTAKRLKASLILNFKLSFLTKLCTKKNGQTGESKLSGKRIYGKIYFLIHCMKSLSVLFAELVFFLK
jgi:hypothetical protein